MQGELQGKNEKYLLNSMKFQIIIVENVKVNVAGTKVNVGNAKVNMVNVKVTIDIAKVKVVGAKVSIEIAKINVGNTKVTVEFYKVGIEFGTSNVENDSFYDKNRMFLCLCLLIIKSQNPYRTFIR